MKGSSWRWCWGDHTASKRPRVQRTCYGLNDLAALSVSREMCSRGPIRDSAGAQRVRRGREVTSTAGGAGQLLAISDLHIGYTENRALVEAMRPESDEDWLLVAGDVSENAADIRWALKTLASRFR